MEMIPIARDDIPGFANANNPWAKLIADFLASDAEAVEIIKLPYGLESVASSLRNTINNNHLPVTVKQRQKRLFLIKKEVSEK